jgi:hypothetical protein
MFETHNNVSIKGGEIFHDISWPVLIRTAMRLQVVESGLESPPSNVRL